MKRRLWVTSGALLVSGCLGFDDALVEFCENHPTRCDGGTVDDLDAGSDAGHDAGVDAGVTDAGIPCAYGTCPQGFVCGYPSARCSHAAACSTHASCPHGQFCGADNLCADPPPACALVQEHAPFVPSGQDGGIVWRVSEPTRTVGSAACAAGFDEVKVRIFAYARNVEDLQRQSGMISKLHRLNSDGGEGGYFVGNAVDGTGALPTLEADVRACPPSSDTGPFTFYLHFVGGNGACATVP